MQKPLNLRALGSASRLLGLEQTVESKPLPAYPFPERTVLVLGRESSGIPAHILQVGGSGQYTSEPLHMKAETEMNQLLAPCASTLKCCLYLLPS